VIKQCFKSALIGLSVAAATSVVQAEAEVQFDPNLEAVAFGQVFDVSLKGVDFHQTLDGLLIDNLSGAQNLTFHYSPAILELVSITIDARWNFGNSVGNIDPVLGVLSGVRFGSFPSTTDDDFNIATITLKALAPGQGSLDLVSGSFSGRFDGVSGRSFTPALGQLDVSVVPEPQHWALLLAGLGLVAFRLRRR
jgi:hypothetical protein